jgi:nitrite reductase (NADH) small subunit
MSAFPCGEVREVIVNGEPFAICNVADRIHALRGICPHQGGRLGQGALHDNMLVCPWHAWEFDCLTGQLDYNESIAVGKLNVRMDGDDVLLDLP